MFVYATSLALLETVEPTSFYRNIFRLNMLFGSTRGNFAVDVIIHKNCHSKFLQNALNTASKGLSSQHFNECSIQQLVVSLFFHFNLQARSHEGFHRVESLCCPRLGGKFLEYILFISIFVQFHIFYFAKMKTICSSISTLKS